MGRGGVLEELDSVVPELLLHLQSALLLELLDLLSIQIEQATDERGGRRSSVLILQRVLRGGELGRMADGIDFIGRYELLVYASRELDHANAVLRISQPLLGRLRRPLKRRRH